MPSNPRRYVLVLKAPDAKGIVAAISGYLAVNDASIAESSHFHEPAGNVFYMRTEFREDGPSMPPIEVLKQGFAPIAEQFGMTWEAAYRGLEVRALPL